jgi:DNA-binding NtrC family response regulator
VIHRPTRPATLAGASQRPRILLVDGDGETLLALQSMRDRLDCDLVFCASPSEALGRSGVQDFDLALIEQTQAGEMSGIQLLGFLKEMSPGVEVIMMTSCGLPPNSEEALKQGAYAWLEKPFESSEQLVSTLLRALAHQTLRQRNEFLERQVALKDKFEDLIGRSDAMQSVFDLIESAAPTDASILIQGESGTGKELIARAIHRRSSRQQGPMITVHCGAIPESLLESELFGHIKGAFTGASQARIGHFEAANGGTIFLDEIGEMTAAAQVKLLRVLQGNEIMRVGESLVRKIDVRVIAASNVNLKESVSRNMFRNDLFYRLNVITVRLPPLKARKADIPLLAQHFLIKFCTRTGKTCDTFSPLVMEALTAYQWPGNVRELENIVESAVVLAKGEVIELSNLSIDFRTRVLASAPGSIPPPAPPSEALIDLESSFSEAKQDVVRRFERDYLRGMLRQTQGNISEAARQSGLDRSNFRRIMLKHKSALKDLL